MTNRPCLDMNKLIEEIKDLCANIGVAGIDDEPFLEVINKCFIGWFSRSMATALFAFCKDEDGDWCVLASERGLEAADFRGMWNCPCGYLDWNEDAKECALRELREECGIDASSANIRLIGVESSPKANRQNVTLRYAAVFGDTTVENLSDFSHEKNEPDEVGEISWIDLNAVDKLAWAFGHKERIHEIASELGLR